MLIIDGMNVMGAVPDGWWKDRNAALRRLVDAVGADADADDVVVVADGRPSADLPAGVHQGVTLLYADRAGPNAADDRIVELVADYAEEGPVTVVTSDRDLVARVAALGAETTGARTFRADRW